MSVAGHPESRLSSGSISSPFSRTARSVSQSAGQPDEGEYEDNTCGLGSWRPAWLQPFASPQFFMLNFSIIAVIQGSYFSYLIGCSSTLEKRFSYSGQLTGFILIADNFSQILISPLIGFLGKKMNKATLIAGGMVFISFSCWVTALPYFMYGPGTHLLGDTNLAAGSSFVHKNVSSLCGAADEIHCDAASKSKSATIWPAYIIIWMASFLNGVGYTAFYTLGFPYVDDNVGKKNAPVYFSKSPFLTTCSPSALTNCYSIPKWKLSPAAVPSFILLSPHLFFVLMTLFQRRDMSALWTTVPACAFISEQMVPSEERAEIREKRFRSRLRRRLHAVRDTGCALLTVL